MLRYCGFEVGTEISLEQMERLFGFLHASFSKEDLIMISQEELNLFAREGETEWR